MTWCELVTISSLYCQVMGWLGLWMALWGREGTALL